MEKYHLMEVVANGSTSTVYLAKHLSSGQLVAVKAMRRNTSNWNLFSNELSMLRQLQYKHVCTLIDYVIESDYLFLITEYFACGDLFSNIQPEVGLEEHVAVSYLGQTCKALHFLHQRGIAHRDIKPENLCLTKDGILKLIDFGFASSSADKEKQLGRGTLCYRSPESIHLGGGLGIAVDMAGDIWSLGVLFFAMLTGNFPWTKAVPSSPEFLRFCKHDFSMPPWSNFPSRILRLLTMMLTVSPTQRATVTQVMEYLERHFGMEFPHENFDDDSVVPVANEGFEVSMATIFQGLDQQCQMLTGVS
eukprot:Colp12_sorted_trinity150504_noHs@23145